MNKKQIIVIAVLTFLFVFGVCMYIARVKYINDIYPQNKRIYVKKSDVYTDENGMEYTITTVDYMTGEEYIKKYGENQDVIGSYPQKVIIATVRLNNMSKKANTYDLSKFYIETPTYCNGICLDSFMQINSCEMSGTIDGGESMDAKLFYTVEDDYISTATWENLKIDDFVLAYGYYTRKVIFELGV